MNPVGLVALMAVLAANTAPATIGAGQRPTRQVAAAPSAAAGPIVVVETERGTFEFETYPDEAPKTTAHVLDLVRKHFYDGQRFHRVIPNFVVQTGDPASRDLARKDDWGTGGSGTTVGAGEFSKRRLHERGAVALANPGDARLGDSQFYVTLTPAPRLDGDDTVFGKVIAGMDVVATLVAGDRIIRASVKGEQ
jgi:cyclophilin family peptidyl-prolyl cis-trans isomerase